MEINPVFSPWQYLFVFLFGFFGSIIIHFFSSRKFYAQKSGEDAIGFAPNLMFYYHNLKDLPPSSLDWPNTKKWLGGAIIAGFLCCLAVLLADLAMYYVKHYY